MADVDIRSALFPFVSISDTKRTSEQVEQLVQEQQFQNRLQAINKAIEQDQINALIEDLHSEKSKKHIKHWSFLLNRFLNRFEVIFECCWRTSKRKTWRDGRRFVKCVARIKMTENIVLVYKFSVSFLDFILCQYVDPIFTRAWYVKRFWRDSWKKREKKKFCKLFMRCFNIASGWLFLIFSPTYTCPMSCFWRSIHKCMLFTLWKITFSSLSESYIFWRV